MIKLHLGCGTKHLKNFTNIDIRYLPGVDEVNNIKFLRNYSKNSVTEIYACHVLEHFGRYEYIEVLRRWYDLLLPGDGQLRLAIPNFAAVVEVYSKTGELGPLKGLLYGGQDYDENFHYNIFDEKSLTADLKDIGFNSVERWNSNENEVDDYSNAYIPHMDNKNGVLMSLNLIAKK